MGEITSKWLDVRCAESVVSQHGGSCEPKEGLGELEIRVASRFPGGVPTGVERVPRPQGLSIPRDNYR